MNDERTRILRMLAEKKISVEECEKMLSALPEEHKVQAVSPPKEKSSGAMGMFLLMVLIGVAILGILALLALGLFIA